MYMSNLVQNQLSQGHIYGYIVKVHKCHGRK